MVGRGLIALITLVPLTLAAPALAEPNVRLNDRVFRVFYQDAPDATLFYAPAVERLSTAATFYDFRSDSSHTGFEKAGRSLFFLFRDIRAGQPDAVSLIITHGIDNPPGGQGSATVTQTITGVPSAATVQVSDDPGELVKQSNGNFVGTWSFGDNTDGGVIGPIATDQAFANPICIRRNQWSGHMNEWQYYFGGSNDFTLDVTRTVCIDYAGPTPGQIATQEGLAVTLCGYFTDAGATSGTYSLDWGDPDAPEAIATGPIAVNTVQCWTHTYGDDGTNLATLSITTATGTHSASATVNVANIAPQVTRPPDATLDNGATYTHALLATDVPADLPLTFALTSAPSGVSLDGHVLTWPTTVADVGVHTLCAAVTDDHDPVEVCWTVTVAPRCDDGAQNGAESDVDCGGTCGPCARGETCATSSDCASGLSCLEGVCGRPCNTNLFLGRQHFVAFYQDAPDEVLFVAPAVERLQTAASFYDYSSASSHTGFEQAGRSLFFLYRDISPGAPDELSLVITHGVDAPPLGTGGQGPATMAMTITGAPETAWVSVSDDPSGPQGIPELRKLADGTFVGDWTFNDNTDGGVIAGLPVDAPWTICLQRTAWSGLTEWQYYFGTDNVTLDPDRVVCLAYRGSGDGVVRGLEGTELTVCGFATDPDDASVELALDWADPNDPLAIATATVAPGVVTCWSHTYRDDVSTTAVLTALSDSGFCSVTVPLEVTIDNVPPTVTRPADAILVPGVAYALELAATDPGDDHPLAFAKVSGPASLTVTGNAIAFTPGLMDAGLHEVCVDVSDDIDTVQTCWNLTVLATCDLLGLVPPGATCEALGGGCGTTRCTALDVWACDYGGGPLTDTTCDGVDDNCDGVVDGDFEPLPVTCGVGVCAGNTGMTTCTQGVPGDSCDPFAGAGDEVCNGLDDDCDETTDEEVCPDLDTRLLTTPPAWTSSGEAAFTFDNPLVAGHTDFECSLDGGEWYDCSSPQSFELAPGTHTFRVRATRGDGAVDLSPATFEWLIDPTLPETTLTATPQDPSQSTSATFGFASSTTAATAFYCVLDPDPSPPTTQDYELCDASTTFDELAEGTHTLWVFAVDGKGDADPNPLVYTWVVDTTPPDTQLTATPPALTTETAFTFTFTSADPSVTRFECRLDQGNWVTCDEGSFAVSGLADGSHTLEVRAIDPAGLADPSPASHTWTVDTTPPATTLLTHPDDPSADTSPTFTFTANEATSGFLCRLDGGEWQACASGLGVEVSDGEHTFEVAAVDLAGLVDPTPAIYTWTVDTHIPETSVTLAPPALVGSGEDAVFAFAEVSDEGHLTFECSLDGGEWFACDGGSYTWDADDLDEGEHTFAVRACDPDKPEEIRCDPVPATVTFEVTASPCPNDAVAPTLTCAAPLTLECVDGSATLELGALAPIASDTCSELTVTTDADTSAPLGESSVVFRAEDGNGNVSSCAVTVTVSDTTPPGATCDADLVVDAASDACEANASPGVTGADACGATTSSSDAPARFPVGTTTVTHTVTDGAGLSATCTQQVTVRDVTAPTVSCGLPSNTPSATPLAITATASDACGATVALTDLACARMTPTGREAIVCPATIAGDTLTVGAALEGADLELTWTARATDPAGLTSGTPCALTVPGLPVAYSASGGGACSGGGTGGLLLGLLGLLALARRRR